jgi:peptidoglycan L-alanyl-D-glutamate endopeptidase CwlK
VDLDAATKARLKLLYPDFAVRVIRVYDDMYRIHGVAMRLTEGVRLWQRQKDLYAQGRTAPGPVVTNSKPGDSLHHYGCAVDSAFTGKDPFLEEMAKGGAEQAKDAAFFWSEYGRIAVAHGLEWGGAWKSPVDKPHIQLRYGGMATQEIRELFLAGIRGGASGFEAVWARFDEIRGSSATSQDRETLATLGKLFELPTTLV